MTYQSHTARPSLFARINAAVSALRSSLRARAEARRIREELSRLTLRELDDIGIAPGDIALVARQAANDNARHTRAA